MAGDWMKIELELPDKPEVHSIAATLNLDPDSVVGKLIRVWQWFDKHTTDGNAFGVTYLLLDRITGVSGFGEAMMFAGWMEQNDKNLTMPKFDRHTSESAKTRALTAKRVAKLRNGGSVTKSVPREEKRREEINTLPGKPDPIPRKTQKLNGAECSVVLDYLNEKAGTRFKPVNANLTLIQARFNEGATLDEIKQVIDAKTLEWKADVKMAKYLRPDTLFNAKKYASYAGQLGDGDSGLGHYI